MEYPVGERSAKHRKKSEVLRERLEAVGEHQHSDDYEKHTRDDFHYPHVPLYFLGEREEAIHREPGKQEGDPESERVRA